MLSLSDPCSQKTGICESAYAVWLPQIWVSVFFAYNNYIPSTVSASFLLHWRFKSLWRFFSESCSWWPLVHTLWREYLLSWLQHLLGWAPRAPHAIPSRVVSAADKCLFGFSQEGCMSQALQSPLQLPLFLVLPTWGRLVGNFSLSLWWGCFFKTCLVI